MYVVMLLGSFPKVTNLSDNFQSGNIPNLEFPKR